MIDLQLQNMFYFNWICVCVFFMRGFVICVATNKQALYFQQHSVYASWATNVIFFPFNRVPKLFFFLSMAASTLQFSMIYNAVSSELNEATISSGILGKKAFQSRLFWLSFHKESL